MYKLYMSAITINWKKKTIKSKKSRRDIWESLEGGKGRNDYDLKQKQTTMTHTSIAPWHQRRDSAGKEVFPTCAAGADVQPEHKPHTLHPGELTRATDTKS